MHTSPGPLVDSPQNRCQPRGGRRNAAFVAWWYGLLVDAGNRRWGVKGGRGTALLEKASSGARHRAAVVNPVGRRSSSDWLFVGGRMQGRRPVGTGPTRAACVLGVMAGMTYCTAGQASSGTRHRAAVVNPVGDHWGCLADASGCDGQRPVGTGPTRAVMGGGRWEPALRGL
jgi:hypothetical protein